MVLGVPVVPISQHGDPSPGPGMGQGLLPAAAAAHRWQSTAQTLALKFLIP